MIPDEKIINIELKEEHSIERGTELKVMEIMKKYPNKNIVVSSFSHNLLRNLKLADPSVKIGLLVEASLLNIDKYIENIGFEVCAYHPGKIFLTQEEVIILKNKNIISFLYIFLKLTGIIMLLFYLHCYVFQQFHNLLYEEYIRIFFIYT